MSCGIVFFEVRSVIINTSNACFSMPMVRTMVKTQYFKHSTLNKQIVHPPLVVLLRSERSIQIILPPLPATQNANIQCPTKGQVVEHMKSTSLPRCVSNIASFYSVLTVLADCSYDQHTDTSLDSFLS